MPYSKAIFEAPHEELRAKNRHLSMSLERIVDGSIAETQRA